MGCTAEVAEVGSNDRGSGAPLANEMSAFRMLMNPNTDGESLPAHVSCCRLRITRIAPAHFLLTTWNAVNQEQPPVRDTRQLRLPPGAWRAAVRGHGRMGDSEQ